MTEEQTPSTFEQLGLRAELLATLASLGYEAPTPIQEKTIPVLLGGRDLIGQAQTGTGKTAAFALPILQKIDPADRSTQALVLAPTRELAMQVAEAFHSYARGIGPVSVLPVYGGAPIFLQLRHLERGAQIVVGTPGRLIDHLERGTLKLDAVKTVVLDEADEMLRMGFIDDVEMILSKVPAPRQTALFSATMPQPIQRIAERHLTEPVKIEIEHRTLAAPAIEQRYLNVSEPQKLDVLVKLLELEESEATIVFRRTKTGAAELAEKLEARGFAAQAMHGDMTQALRESVIRRLKAGQIEVVVATDVAARGLDVEQIAHVVNYDIPHDEEVYVHRIGRTGRAGRSGVATLFVTPRERRMLRDIERFTGSKIDTMKMPTRADVHAKRIAVFKDSVRKAIDEGDLDLYVGLVTEIAEESGRDIAEVAAAAARLANASRSLQLEAEPNLERRETEGKPDARAPRSKQPDARAKDELKWKRQSELAAAETRREAAPPWREAMSAWPEGGDAGARKESFGALPKPRAARPSRPSREGFGEAKARLVIALGSEHGLTAKNVVGSIANEADVPGRDIGPIEIGETSTIVVVPEAVADRVIEKCADSRLKGKAFRIRREGSPEVKGQRSTQADEAPEAAGQEHAAADSFEWTPTAGERLRKKLRRDDEAPPEGDARTRPESQQTRPPGHTPFYERFKSAGDDKGGAPPPKKPFRRAADAGSKPTGDRPYRPRPAGGDAPPFKKPYGKPPFRRDGDAGAKPYGGKPYRARTEEGGAPPFKREYEKKPFRKEAAPGAKPYGDKPYAKRATEGGAPPRGKSFGSKKRFEGDKGGFTKPDGKKPFYDKVKGSKFRKKPK